MALPVASVRSCHALQVPHVCGDSWAEGSSLPAQSVDKVALDRAEAQNPSLMPDPVA